MDQFSKRPFTLAMVFAMFLFVTLAQAADPAAPAAHPLDPVLLDAQKRLEVMKRGIRDYTCTLTKRERVKGQLLDYQQIFVRVRHEPFSVYLYFLGPEAVKGQQVVYVEGRNNGKLIAQPVGLRGIAGPYNLDPTGALAMDGQRYPIMMTGFVKLTEQLIAEGMRDRLHPECTVKYYKGAKVEDRVCTVTEITHPPRKHFQFSMARIFVDDELNIPIRFESYRWPTTPGGEPLLLEEYTYSNVKLNVGLTDADFTIRSK